MPDLPARLPARVPIPTTRGGAAGGAPRDRLSTLKDVLAVTPDQLPEDKAAFHGLVASVAMVNTEQTMWYLANPENGRKVRARACACVGCGGRVCVPGRGRS